MRRPLALTLVLLSTLATAQDRRTAKEQELKKASSVAPDKSLAGDVTRKKEEIENAPALRYDQFRLGVEVQVASKRKQLIENLQQIIQSYLAHKTAFEEQFKQWIGAGMDLSEMARRTMSDASGLKTLFDINPFFKPIYSKESEGAGTDKDKNKK